jgi:hypothetical protein
MVPPPPRWPVFDPRIRQIAPAPVSAGIVTRRLRGLIDDGDLETMRSRLDAGERRVLEAADADRRPYLELALCVHHGIEPVLGKTGLSAAGPPATVHSMARGAESAGGSYYYADLVAEGLKVRGAIFRTSVAPSTSAAPRAGSSASSRLRFRTWTGTAVIRTPQQSSGRGRTSPE